MLNQNFYRRHSFTEIYSNNITSGKGILNILGMMIDDKTLFGGKRILNIFGPLVCHAHSLFDTFYIKVHWPLIKVVAYLQKSFNEKDSFFLGGGVYMKVLVRGFSFDFLLLFGFTFK